MKIGKIPLFVLCGIVITFFFGFNSGSNHNSKTKGLTSILIFDDDTTFGNHDSLKYGHNLSYRMNQYIIWGGWNSDNLGTDTTNVFIDVSNPAVGRSDFHWHVAAAPNPRFWLEAYIWGLGQPIDASSTGRVTFWVRAKAGSHGFRFWVEDASFNGSAGQSAAISINGATVFANNQVIVSDPFNNTWQFVSIPWSLLTSKDTAFVRSNTFAGSWTHTDNAFNNSMVRDFQFDSNALNPPHTGTPTWVDDYYLDQMQLVPEATGVTGINGEQNIPIQYKLDQNYPNPFNPTTQISYNLPQNVTVSLKIYNIMGKEVKTLVNNQLQSPGSYTVQWDGRDNSGNMVASGTYLYRIQASHFTETKKMILLK